MIDYKDRVLTHIAAAIDDAEDEVPIYAGDYSSVLGGAGDVYLIILGPAAREIILVKPGESSWGKFIKVLRGQGGTAAMAWPAGSKIFGSTTAEGYNAIIQADPDARQIAANPNQSLAPLYAGEKVYQNNVGYQRWWKAYDAVNPYWDLITGVPGVGESYEDIGWKYKLLIL